MEVMMDSFTLKERTIPYDGSWDVIVAGGGPAGCAAAAAAAREGAKALLIEATGVLGGMGTGGLVPAWCPFSDLDKIIYRGIAQKVFEACKKGMPHVKADAMDWVPIDPELLKRIYDDLVTKSGVQVLFNTFLSAVDRDENGSITTVLVSNKAGLTAYHAKVYIDCTGDADLAAWAGAEFLKGDEKTGELQRATHCFVLTNVDEYAYLNGPSLHTSNPASPVYDILKSGEFPEIIDAYCCNNVIGPSTVGFNAGHLENVDNTDPINVSKALIRGRKIAAAYRDGLAKFHPKAFSNAFLVTTGSLIGIRETRRIIGDYTLCEQDYLDRKSFDDEICRCSYYIDVHRTMMTMDDTQQSEFPRYEKGESFGIPYRCLTPKKLKNVLVAGRSISCTRPLQGSTRVMPVCLAMGEAAGMAAVMGTKMTEIDLHKVNTVSLRTALKEKGVYLP
jgi:hypothetical protein